MPRCVRAPAMFAVAVFVATLVTLRAHPQQPAASPSPAQARLSLATQPPPAPKPVAPEQLPAPGFSPHIPVAATSGHAFPINLATALALARVEPLDIAIAQQRVEVAAAQLERANRLWLPTIYLGGDYFRHDGQLQDVGGAVFGSSKSNMMVGVGPSMVFSFSDALLAPLAARQVVQAQWAGVQAAQNDTFLSVGEAFFSVQQARGELAGAAKSFRRGEDLVGRAEKLAKNLVPPVEAARARTELARRRQALFAARERWQVASAELARVLRLEPTSLVEPIEPPDLQITLVDPRYSVDELIPIALTYRPELAAQQAFVQATLERLRQERLRPLIPSLLIRGSATPVTGTLSTGYFGGGRNDDVSNFSARNDIDVQLLWTLENLGLGNRAKVSERRAENQVAMLELFRLQ